MLPANTTDARTYVRTYVRTSKPAPFFLQLQKQALMAVGKAALLLIAMGRRLGKQQLEFGGTPTQLLDDGSRGSLLVDKRPLQLGLSLARFAQVGLQQLENMQRVPDRIRV